MSVKKNGSKNGVNGHDEGVGLKGAPPLRETYRGKHLLVTGVTGFLGKVWLAMVLDHLPELGKATVIVRPKKGEDGTDGENKDGENKDGEQKGEEEDGGGGGNGHAHAHVGALGASRERPGSWVHVTGPAALKRRSKCASERVIEPSSRSA